MFLGLIITQYVYNSVTLSFIVIAHAIIIPTCLTIGLHQDISEITFKSNFKDVSNMFFSIILFGIFFALFNNTNDEWMDEMNDKHDYEN